MDVPRWLCCVGLDRASSTHGSKAKIQRATDGTSTASFSASILCWLSYSTRPMPASSYLLSCVHVLVSALLPSRSLSRRATFFALLTFQQNLWSAQCDISGSNRRFGELSSVSPGRPTVTFSTTLLRERQAKKKKKEDEGRHLARIYLDDQRSWIEYIEEYCWLTAFIPPDRPASFIDDRPSFSLFSSSRLFRFS